MKLVDILARDLPIWPDNAKALSQSFAGMIFFIPHGFEVQEINRLEQSEDWREAAVTMTEWKAAVDALKTYNDEMVNKKAAHLALVWNGKGRPPAGAKVEIIEVRHPHQKEWLGKIVTVVNTFENQICEEFVTVESDSADCDCFTIWGVRPAKTLEQIAKASEIEELKEMLEIFLGGFEDSVLNIQSGLIALRNAGYRKFEIVDGE